MAVAKREGGFQYGFDLGNEEVGSVVFIWSGAVSNGERGNGLF